MADHITDEMVDAAVRAGMIDLSKPGPMPTPRDQARAMLSVVAPFIRAQAFKEVIRVAEMMPSTPLCPITNAKRGDPLYDSTDDTVCPLCGETGHDNGRKCVNSMGGRLSAAILALAEKEMTDV